MKGWGVYVVVAIAVFTYKVMTTADRDDSGAIVESGSVDAFDLRVGDCFDDSDSFGDEISSLPGVPCSEPHDNETYAVITVDLPEYPGDDMMGEIATDKCLEAFDGFVGKAYEDSSLDIFPLYPSSQSWKNDDREVVCALYDMNYEKLVGTAQGSAL